MDEKRYVVAWMHTPDCTLDTTDPSYAMTLEDATAHARKLNRIIPQDHHFVQEIKE